MITCNEITYVRRVNLGDYSYEELSISATPNDEVDPVLAAQDLKGKVLVVLGLKSPTTSAVQEEPKAVPTVAPAASATPAVQTEPAKRGRGRPVVNKEAEAPAKDEVQQAPAPTTSTPASSPSTTPAKTSKKIIRYDRTVSFQSDALAEALEKVIPGWMEDPAKIAKAKEGSLAMKGEEFMDSAEGVILPSFMEKFLKVAGFESKKVSL